MGGLPAVISSPRLGAQNSMSPILPRPIGVVDFVPLGSSGGSGCSRCHAAPRCRVLRRARSAPAGPRRRRVRAAGPPAWLEQPSSRAHRRLFLTAWRLDRFVCLRACVGVVRTNVTGMLTRSGGCPPALNDRRDVRGRGRHARSRARHTAWPAQAGRRRASRPADARARRRRCASRPPCARAWRGATARFARRGDQREPSRVRVRRPLRRRASVPAPGTRTSSRIVPSRRESAVRPRAQAGANAAFAGATRFPKRPGSEFEHPLETTKASLLLVAVAVHEVVRSRREGQQVAAFVERRRAVKCSSVLRGYSLGSPAKPWVTRVSVSSARSTS